MLTVIEGVYENGVVRLLEPLPAVEHARVVVMVFPEPNLEERPRKTLRKMSPEQRQQYLRDMRDRWRGQLSSSEEFARLKHEEVDLENRRWSEGA